MRGVEGEGRAVWDRRVGVCDEVVSSSWMGKSKRLEDGGEDGYCKCNGLANASSLDSGEATMRADGGEAVGERDGDDLSGFELGTR